MAIFEPRTKDEIRESIMAKLVATSPLTDVAEGGTAHTIAGVFAEELEGVEYRIKKVRDAFWMDASGADLDERVRDLPGGGPARLQAASAVGSALQITRDDTSGDLTIPAGSLAAREDDPQIVYQLTSDVVIPDGYATYPVLEGESPAHIACLTPGTVGDADVGTITLVVEMPSSVISVTNTEPVIGRDRETDEQYRERVQRYLSSLARCLPGSLEYLALTFKSSSGARAIHARVWEDPENRGYSELVIDDGTGLGPGGKKGVAVGPITVPDNGTPVLWHEAPAQAAITEITVNGEAHKQTLGGVQNWVSIPERGVVYPVDGFLSPEDTWSITSYLVWTGLVRELQAVVEQDPRDRLRSPGWRASGTRVRVVPPTPQPVVFDLNITAAYTVEDLSDLQDKIKAEIIAFLRGLGPGEPLILFQLNDKLANLTGVENILYNAPTGDVYTTSPRHSLTTNTTLITGF